MNIHVSNYVENNQQEDDQNYDSESSVYEDCLEEFNPCCITSTRGDEGVPESENRVLQLSAILVRARQSLCPGSVVSYHGMEDEEDKDPRPSVSPLTWLTDDGEDELETLINKEQDIYYDCTGLPSFTGDEKEEGNAKLSLNVTVKMKDQNLPFREAVSVLEPIPNYQKDQTKQTYRTDEEPTQWCHPSLFTSVHEDEMDEHPKSNILPPACTAGVTDTESNELGASNSFLKLTAGKQGGHCKEHLSPLYLNQLYDDRDKHPRRTMVSKSESREKHQDLERPNGHFEPSPRHETDEQSAKHPTPFSTERTFILQSNVTPCQLLPVFPTKSEATEYDTIHFSTSFFSETRSADLTLLLGERDLESLQRGCNQSMGFRDDTSSLMDEKKYHIPANNNALVSSVERRDVENNKGNHVSSTSFFHAATVNSNSKATELAKDSLVKLTNSSPELCGMHDDLQPLNISATISDLKAECLAEDHVFSHRLHLKPDKANVSLSVEKPILTTAKQMINFDLQKANDTTKPIVNGHLALHAKPSVFPMSHGNPCSSKRLSSTKAPVKVSDSSTAPLLRFNKCLPPGTSMYSSSGIKSLPSTSSYWHRPTAKDNNTIDHRGRVNQRNELLSDIVSHTYKDDNRHYNVKAKPNSLLGTEKVNNDPNLKDDEKDEDRNPCLPPCQHPVSRRVSTVWFPTPSSTLSTKASQHKSKNLNPCGFNPKILYFGEELHDNISKLMPPPKTGGKAHERENRRRPYSEVGAATSKSITADLKPPIFFTKQHHMVNGYEADDEGENTSKIKSEKIDSTQSKSNITKDLSSEMKSGSFLQIPVSAIYQESMLGYGSGPSRSSTSGHTFKEKEPLQP
ncbi:uncharacterized protein LOC121704993 [Alosa sapidissima]|uniref:uncharacterized protein LOC121704993 n=1 Tax=Alosa sapidissima TaxID=34773 RepID=UPI001C08E0B0|nr:uncharacterized protein LOC121704993 [Alosa sapidissima]XP_041941577.1 uncharacterized protein LOC121704993 [Alosa sapidissima]